MIEVCKLNELIEKKGKRVFLNETEIAVFLVNGVVYALSNVCPHQHSAIICDGFIEDEFVVCPAHGWKFRLKDGKKENGYNGLKSYLTKVIDGKVFIEFKEDALNWLIE